MAPLWKLLPLISIVWLLLLAGYEPGDSPLIEGAGTAAVTVKLNVLEVCPSGLVTRTVQVPASLALLNEWLNWLLETKVGVRT